MPDARPLVLLAHQGADWIRGAEQCLLDLAAGIDRTRFRLVVACSAPTLAREMARRDVEAHVVGKFSSSAVTAALRRPHLRRLLAGRDVSIVHANMPHVLPTLLPVARTLRVAVVAHLHLPYGSFLPRLQRAVRRCTAVVGVAEHVVAPLRAAGGPAVHVILNGVDRARLAAGDASGLRAALGVPPTATVSCALGSLIHRKGLDVLLRGLAVARARGADVRLLLCGEGEERPALEALAASLGVADAAHFLGMRGDAGAVLRDAADLLVTSAREEALPLNVLEAQALGVAVLASDIPAHREALVPDVTGVLVPGESPDALGAALAALAADPARRAALGAAGRAHAAARFDVGRYVREFEALYAALLDRRVATTPSSVA